MTGPTVLALDLSTPRGVIAVLRPDGQPASTAIFTSERSHNAQVFAPLRAALASVGAGPALLVIGTGPGSYTGVRIAIAAAQGIALARGWPLIGLPSIATGPHAAYQVLGDARRGHYYTASVQEGRLIHGPELLDAEAARARVEAQPGPWLTFDARPPLGLEQISPVEVDATALARAAARLTREEVQALAARPLEPCYLQEAFITTARKAGKHVPQFRASEPASR